MEKEYLFGKKKKKKKKRKKKDVKERKGDIGGECKGKEERLR